MINTSSIISIWSIIHRNSMNALTKVLLNLDRDNDIYPSEMTKMEQFLISRQIAYVRNFCYFVIENFFLSRLEKRASCVVLFLLVGQRHPWCDFSCDILVKFFFIYRASSEITLTDITRLYCASHCSIKTIFFVLDWCSSVDRFS